MRTTSRLFIFSILTIQLSCSNQEESEKFSLSSAQDSAQNTKLSDLETTDNGVDIVFSVLQGEWKLTRKYTPSGKTIQTIGTIILTVRDSFAIKTNNKETIWTDTLFRHFYFDSVSEFYGKTDPKSGIWFDKRHPKKLSLLYGKGDLGGEDYIKIE